MEHSCKLTDEQVQRLERLTAEYPGLSRLFEQWQALGQRAAKAVKRQDSLKMEASRLSQQLRPGQSRAALRRLTQKWEDLCGRERALVAEGERLRRYQRQLFEQMTEALVPVFSGPRAFEYFWLAEVVRTELPQDLVEHLKNNCPNF